MIPKAATSRIDLPHAKSSSTIPGPQVSPATSPATSPGQTIVWIGPREECEFHEAYEFCATRSSQLAWRESLEHYLNQPAEGVGRIIVTRRDRSATPERWQAVVEITPGVQRYLLLGSLCEGELRRGEPWEGARAVYWHAWNQVMPQWFRRRSGESGVSAERLTVLGITRSIDLADAIQAALVLDGHAICWAPAPASAAAANVDVVLWDDTAAPPCSAAQWRARCARFTAVRSRRGGTMKPIQHLWCAGFPRYEDWLEARRGGCHALVSKPCGDEVFRFLFAELARSRAPRPERSAENGADVKPLPALTSHPFG